jgi:hypothetical protein
MPRGGGNGMKFYITSVTNWNLDRFGVYCLKQGKLYEKNWDLSSFNFEALKNTSLIDVAT